MVLGSSWRGCQELMEVSLVMRFAFGIDMEEPPSPRFFRRQHPKELVAPSRKLKFPRRPIHPAQPGTGRPLPCSQTAGGTSHAHAGSRTRVTSMGGLYDAATLRAPVASRMHTHRYRLSQAILPSSELSASMAGISRQKTSPQPVWTLAFAGGHTASNAPDLFRAPKLSGAGPG